MSGESLLERALRSVARDAAAELIERVLDDSRRDAADSVRARLTAAMVEEMERLLASGGSGPIAARTAGEEPGRVIPIAGAADPVSLSGWYVYGLTWESAARSLDATAGIDGAPVEVLASGSLAAVVSPITDTTQWGIDPAGEVDLEMLAPRAHKHEWVLEEMLDRGAVLPLRFGVLYPDLDPLKEMLRERESDLAAVLTRLQGHREWGLLVTVDDCSPVPATQAGSPAGRDYLSRRREERIAAGEQAEALARVAAAIHKALTDVSTDAVVHRPGGASAGKQSVVLRASYLVSSGSETEFRAAAEAKLSESADSLRLAGELTGPWPPYHFCDVALDEVPE